MRTKWKHHVILYLLIALVIIAGLLFTHPAHPEEQGEQVAKVVWHVDFGEPRRFSAMLTSIFNMVTTYENELREYDVRIVLLSRGIRFATRDKLKGTPFEEDKPLAQRRNNLLARLNSLREVQGVKVYLCDITRKSIGLDKDKIIPGIQLVPSGVVEIARLQSQGFAYLKAD